MKQKNKAKYKKNKEEVVDPNKITLKCPITKETLRTGDSCYLIRKCEHIISLEGKVWLFAKPPSKRKCPYRGCPALVTRVVKMVFQEDDEEFTLADK